MMKKIKAHVVDGKVYVMCPGCKKGVQGKLRNKTKSRVVACCPACAGKFLVQLDYRQQHRKPAEFSGTCSCKRISSFPVMINNISKMGIQFKQLRNDEKLHIGEIVNLQFQLNDKKSSNINVTVKICNSSGSVYGGMFAEKYWSYRANRDIGFWLL